MNYGRIKGMSGTQLLKHITAIMHEPENMMGSMLLLLSLLEGSFK